MAIRYPAFIDIADDKVLVRFHDFPEIFCAGSDEEEALFHATEALTTMLTRSMDHDQDIPRPTRNVEGAIWIIPNVIVQSALRRYFQSGASGSSDGLADKPILNSAW